MKRFSFLILLLGCLTLPSYAQNLAIKEIPDSLKKNAFAVVRVDSTGMSFSNYKKILIHARMVVTVLDKQGLYFAFEPAYYNKSVKIKSYQATLYDSTGKVVKTLGKDDLIDKSIAEGASMFTDRRVQFYNFTPTDYPFTIEYTTIYESTNTAFIPKWQPLNNFNVSIQSASVSLLNTTGDRVRMRENNFDYAPVKKIESENQVTFSVSNLPAIKDESLSPALSTLTPEVRFAPTHFQLEGVEGRFDDWTGFGKWYYNNLFKNNQDLPKKEQAEVLAMIKNVDNDYDKIRILYQYMQSRTRYFNVAIGIGGWKPYPASYVSAKGYGDCKALSNYMISLLDVAGIKAYPTIIHGNADRKENVDQDFASLEGNHMIVNVPMDKDTVWLECTSQQSPFNHLGLFTDDRYAISVTPEGGKVVSTQEYPVQTNLEIVSGAGSLTKDGNLALNLTMKDTGLQYDWSVPIYYEKETDQKEMMKSLFPSQPRLAIEKLSFDNNKNQAVFVTQMDVTSPGYGKMIGDNILMKVLPLGNRDGTGIIKDADRQLPFSIRFGYVDRIDLELTLPEGYKLSEPFETKTLKSDFGDYRLTVEQTKPGVLTIQRSLKMNNGTYSKDRFNDYVEFRRQIGSMDNSKVLLE